MHLHINGDNDMEEVYNIPCLHLILLLNSVANEQ